MRPEDFVGASDNWIDPDPKPALKKPKPVPAAAAPEPPAEYAVFWMPVYCPNCGNRNCPAYDSGDGITRYHKCPACKHNFKSIEIVPDHIKKIRSLREKRAS